MTPIRVDALLRLRDLLAQIRALRHLDALCGDPPAVPFSAADPADPRFRPLRALPGMGTRPVGDRLARIWLRDHRRCILFHALLRSSAWMNGTACSLTVAELARLSGLSVQSVLLALRDARLAGDFIADRAAEDRRRLALEPAPALRALAEARRRAYLAAACALTGRPDPTSQLTAEAAHAWRRLYAELCVNKVGGAEPRRARLATAARALLLWDLVVEGPQPLRLFVPAQRQRRQASRQTIMNHLAWLRARGWLEPGDPLVPTALARARFGAMLGVFETGAQRVLDLLELLAAEPALAACVALPAEDAVSPRPWLRCRIGAVLPHRRGVRWCPAPHCPLARTPPDPAEGGQGAGGGRLPRPLPPAGMVGTRGIAPLPPAASR